MYQFINLPFGRVGTFPICIGLGLLVLVLLVLHAASWSSLSSTQKNERLLPALPFCLLFGVAIAGFTDSFFHDGFWAACRNPFGNGVNYFGWLSGCLIFLLAFGLITGISPQVLFEIFLPACLPAQAVGRIGCFLGGCCYGVPVNPSWGVVYPDGSLPFAMYGVTPLMPVQLYEAAWLVFAFCIVSFWVRPRFRAGVVLVAMGIGRFSFEFFRGDSRGTFLMNGILSPAQCFSIFFVTIGCLIIVQKRWPLIWRIPFVKILSRKKAVVPNRYGDIG